MNLDYESPKISDRLEIREIKDVVCRRDIAVRNETVMTKSRIIKNLLILSLGYVFLFTSFMALFDLQSTLNSSGNIGVFAQSNMCGAVVLSSLLFPKLIINKIGCNWTLVFGISSYLPYIAANFYPSKWTLWPSAVLVGAGGSILWTSALTYINNLSLEHANGDVEKAALSTSRFFGIFQMFYQSTHIWGNLVTFYVLSPPDEAPDTYRNETSNNSDVNLPEEVLCGARYCGGIHEVMKPPSSEERYTLIGIFFTFSVISAVIVIFLVDSLEKKEKVDSEEKILQKLGATFKQMIKLDHLLVAVLKAFSGFEEGFIFADYTEAYVTCAWGLKYVGLVFVCFGVVNSIMSFAAGQLIKIVPRFVLMIAAALSNIAACGALLVWNPNNEQVFPFFVIVGFWAFSDAIWMTQLSALYGIVFRSDEEAAFANYALFEALGCTIAFVCSGLLCASTKIYLLAGFLTVGMTGYIAVEVRMHRRKRSYCLTKPVELKLHS